MLHAKSLQLCPILCDPVDCSLLVPLSMGFSDWSGLPCPPPGDLPEPGIELVSPALQADSLRLSHWGSPNKSGYDIGKGHWDGFCWRQGSDWAHGRSGA